MTTSTLTPPSSRTTGPEVWAKVWQSARSETADDAWLAREERTPRWSAVLQHLDDTFGRLDGLRTVELGAGRGDLSALLAARGAEVTLLDYSASALEQAQERFDRLGLSAHYVRGDLLGPLGVHDGAYDVSLSSGVLEHFVGGQRSRALQAHYRVLRPSGLAVVSVPYAWCWPYRLWKLYLELRGWWPYGLEMPFSTAELRWRAQRVGFARSATRRVGFWQSIGDHWLGNLFKRPVDWAPCTSRLDQLMGMNLLLFAWVGGEPAEATTRVSRYGI